MTAATGANDQPYRATTLLIKIGPTRQIQCAPGEKSWSQCPSYSPCTTKPLTAITWVPDKWGTLGPHAAGNDPAHAAHGKANNAY
jgi:hypothetical protein